MSETSGAPNEPKKSRHKEYEDPHYHDDDEVAQVPSDDQDSSRKPPSKNIRSLLRRASTRRHSED